MPFVPKLSTGLSLLVFRQTNRPGPARMTCGGGFPGVALGNSAMAVISGFSNPGVGKRYVPAG